VSGVIFMMIGVSIVLAFAAILGVLWGVKNKQFDDYTKFLDGTKFDSEEALNEAYQMELRRKEAERSNKEK